MGLELDYNDLLKKSNDCVVDSETVVHKQKLVYLQSFLINLYNTYAGIHEDVLLKIITIENIKEFILPSLTHATFLVDEPDPIEDSRTMYILGNYTSSMCLMIYFSKRFEDILFESKGDEFFTQFKKVSDGSYEMFSRWCHTLGIHEYLRYKTCVIHYEQSDMQREIRYKFEANQEEMKKLLYAFLGATEMLFDSCSVSNTGWSVCYNILSYFLDRENFPRDIMYYKDKLDTKTKWKEWSEDKKWKSRIPSFLGAFDSITLPLDAYGRQVYEYRLKELWYTTEDGVRIDCPRKLLMMWKYADITPKSKDGEEYLSKLAVKWLEDNLGFRYEKRKMPTLNELVDNTVSLSGFKEIGETYEQFVKKDNTVVITQKSGSSVKTFDSISDSPEDFIKFLRHLYVEYGSVPETILDECLTTTNTELFIKPGFTHETMLESKNYETLETVGDSILNKCVVWYLMRRFPNFYFQARENTLDHSLYTEMKKRFTAKSEVIKFCKTIGLNKWIRFKEIIIAQPAKYLYAVAHKKEDVCEDVMEAFLCCTYLLFNTVYQGYGYKVCYNIMQKILDNEDIIPDYDVYRDPKNKLTDYIKLCKDKWGDNFTINDVEYKSREIQIAGRKQYNVSLELEGKLNNKHSAKFSQSTTNVKKQKAQEDVAELGYQWIKKTFKCEQ